MDLHITSKIQNNFNTITLVAYGFFSLTHPQALDGFNCKSKGEQWKEKELGRTPWLIALWG
jgi:hypothetical protein